MKNIKIIPVIFALSILSFISCNDDFLETKPLDEFASVDVWKDMSLSKTFVNGIYASFNQSMQKYMKSVFCDEGHRRDNTACFNFNICLLTPDNIPG